MLVGHGILCRCRVLRKALDGDDFLTQRRHGSLQMDGNNKVILVIR